MAVPTELRNTDASPNVLSACFLFYLGNRGCKIAGIRRNTDTFDFCLQVVLLNISRKTLEVNTRRMSFVHTA